MIKKTITYVDYAGKEHTEELRFHMNKLDYAKFIGAMGVDDIEDRIKEIVSTGNKLEMIKLIQDVLVQAYGEMDGDIFVKNDTIRKRFENSEQLAEVFADVITDEASAKEFFSHIYSTPSKPKALPKKVATKRK